MRKLRRLIGELARLRSISIDEARALATNRIAVLQLVAYHSPKFGECGLIDRLPSAQLARRVAHSASANKLLVAPRATRHWGFSEGDESSKLVVYPANLGASASLGPESPGGRAMLRALTV